MLGSTVFRVLLVRQRAARRLATRIANALDCRATIVPLCHTFRGAHSPPAVLTRPSRRAHRSTCQVLSPLSIALASVPYITAVPTTSTTNGITPLPRLVTKPSTRTREHTRTSPWTQSSVPHPVSPRGAFGVLYTQQQRVSRNPLWSCDVVHAAFCCAGQMIHGMHAIMWPTCLLLWYTSHYARVKCCVSAACSQPMCKQVRCTCRCVLLVPISPREFSWALE